MHLPKLTNFEMQIMETLWSRGPCPIRDLQESFPAKDRPAYTTVQTMVYRLEAKKVVRRVRKIGGAHVFEAVVSRSAAHGRLIDDLLTILGGTQPVMAHFIESGKLNIKDVDEARETIRKLAKRSKKSGAS